MKKILLIGKLNEITRSLNDFLADQYHVQLCSENTETAEGMLKIVKPDLVIVSLVGLYDADGRIFYVLSEEYADTPVLTIGTQEECKVYLKYYETKQFENLIRPIKNEDVLEKCREILKDDSGDRRKRILVVDDSPVILRSMKAMLGGEYEVALATSGVQAMTSIGKSRPDLIFLDYEMPVCDGRMTLEMIRKEEELRNIPVIFLTGVADKEHIEAVLKLKPEGYFLKPANEEQLKDAINKIFNKKGGEA